MNLVTASISKMIIKSTNLGHVSLFWITIQVAYEMSVVLLGCLSVAEINHGGVHDLRSSSTCKAGNALFPLTFTVLVRRKTQPKTSLKIFSPDFIKGTVKK